MQYKQACLVYQACVHVWVCLGNRVPSSRLSSSEDKHGPSAWHCSFHDMGPYCPTSPPHPSIFTMQWPVPKARDLKEQGKLLTGRRPLARRTVKAPGVCVCVCGDDRARESSQEPGQQMRPGPWREGPREALPYSSRQR